MTSSTDYTSSCFHSPQYLSLTCLELERSPSVPREYIDLARQVLSDRGPVIDGARLTLIVEAALEVLTFFFAAALHEPTQPELHELFEDFLTRCIVGYKSEEIR